MLPLSGDRKPFPFLATRFDEGPGAFSLDGRWVAYASNESGRPEVSVAPFPGPGGKWLISSGGGTQPRWRADGQEIFYLAPENKLMAAAVEPRGAAFVVGAVRSLFDVRPRVGLHGSLYAAAPDGNSSSSIPHWPAAQTPMTVVLNWPALLKK